VLSTATSAPISRAIFTTARKSVTRIIGLVGVST
jgi:hypothetical protein